MRWIVYGVAGLLLLLAGGIAVLAVKVIEDGPNTADGVLGQATVGGPFALVAGDGRKVTERDFRGKRTIVYFGFTYCPDVCPTELAAIADALDLLTPEEAAKFQPIFITVDPERDTAEVVGDYAAAFHPSMIGLSGSKEQIHAAAQAYRVYYAKQAPNDAGDYVMTHSSYIYVMDAEGKYAIHFRMGTTPEAIAAGLKALL